MFDFFQQASELEHQNEASILNAKMQVKSGTFSTTLPLVIEHTYWPQVVDRCASVSLARFALFVGDSYGVDALGNIWLNGDDDVEAWTKFLHKV